MKWWVKVEGLAGPEVRQLAEKVGEQPEQQTEAEKLVEFSVPSYQVNRTESLGNIITY